MNNAIILAAQRAGAHLLPDNAQWQYRMEIRSESSSRVYVVAQRKSTGEWACSCPGQKRWGSGGRGQCKHLKTMVPLLTAPEGRPRLH